jgi:hypothetical protein
VRCSQLPLCADALVVYAGTHHPALWQRVWPHHLVDDPRQVCVSILRAYHASASPSASSSRAQLSRQQQPPSPSSAPQPWAAPAGLQSDTEATVQLVTVASHHSGRPAHNPLLSRHASRSPLHTRRYPRHARRTRTTARPPGAANRSAYSALRGSVCRATDGRDCAHGAAMHSAPAASHPRHTPLSTARANALATLGTRLPGDRPLCACVSHAESGVFLHCPGFLRATDITLAAPCLVCAPHGIRMHADVSRALVSPRNEGMQHHVCSSPSAPRVLLSHSLCPV